MQPHTARGRSVSKEVLAGNLGGVKGGIKQKRGLGFGKKKKRTPILHIEEVSSNMFY